MSFLVQKYSFTSPVGDVEFTARVNPRTTARVGDAVKFALDLSKMHIFDKESGLAIAF